MQKHESQNDYNFRTAIFLKNVYIYSNGLPSQEKMNAFKSLVIFGLNNYLHSKKISISLALELNDSLKRYSESFDYDFNSQEFVRLIELYNSDDKYESFMFYSDLSHPKSLMHHSLVHYLYFNDLSNVAEKNNDSNYKNLLHASNIHYEMGMNILNHFETDYSSKIRESINNI